MRWLGHVSAVFVKLLEGLVVLREFAFFLVLVEFAIVEVLHWARVGFGHRELEFQLKIYRSDETNVDLGVSEGFFEGFTVVGDDLGVGAFLSFPVFDAVGALL